MTTRILGIALLATLLMLAPLATASADGAKTDGAGGERPDDAAWVEDCPPDMMCAFASEPDDDEPTRGPEDCEYCRDHQDADCPDCITSHTPADDSDDGTTWGTDCPPEVYCMYDGGSGSDRPDDAAWEECDSEICIAGEADTQESPAGAFVVALLGVLAVALVARRRF